MKRTGDTLLWTIAIMAIIWAFASTLKDIFQDQAINELKQTCVMREAE